MIRFRDTIRSPLEEQDDRRYPLRRKARVMALKLLYQMDINHEQADSAFHTFFQRNDVARASEQAKEYAKLLCKGIVDKQLEIDTILDGVSEHWKIERMAAVDRNILRIAVFEFLQAEVPSKVVIDEAIEVAKEFGSADSAKFINGLLDAVLKGLDRQDEDLDGRDR